MICYYRNGISCVANRREFEDQSEIKGKLYQIGIKAIRVSHFGDFFWRAFREERKKESKEENKKKNIRKAKKGMDEYGFLDFCMDISLFHF